MKGYRLTRERDHQDGLYHLFDPDNVWVRSVASRVWGRVKARELNRRLDLGETVTDLNIETKRCL